MTYTQAVLQPFKLTPFAPSPMHNRRSAIAAAAAAA
jgi:hypothetical protein